MSARLRAALAYAERGIPVLAVNGRTKVPLLTHGVLAASADPELIRRWFSELFPGAGVALAMGLRSGLVALDCDPRHGGDDGLAEACGRLGALPRTAMVITPSGGTHRYFTWRYGDGLPIRNSAGKLGPGLDVRGEGGYVIAPPSAGYRWAIKIAPAPLPAEWAAELIEPATPSGRDWSAVIAGGLPAGRRNMTVASVAGHLLRRYVDPDLALELLGHYNVGAGEPPLPEDELVRTFASVERAELRRRAAQEAARGERKPWKAAPLPRSPAPDRGVDHGA